MSIGSAPGKSGEIELDPYSCLTKKGPKYAAETEEVYLANLGGTTLSENFKYFFNLEVVWFNNNRLTQLNNLDACFRIREIYVQNNRLPSLNFLKQFKFLKVLLASNNQIKNLDKQLGMLSKLSYLKKLDLYENSVADEPDYRNRMIYHLPQIEILDRLGVTMAQRQRADEVVPNMDKVAAPPPVKAAKPPYTFTAMERSCFRTAKTIRECRRQADEDSMKTQAFSKSVGEGSPVPVNRVILDNQLKWSSPSRIVQHEQTNLTPWERQWGNSTACQHHPSMLAQIEELAGKAELNMEDVTKLARQLHQEGIEDFGRYLSRPDVFAPTSEPLRASRTLRMSKSATNIVSSPTISKSHPLDALAKDAEVTMPTKQVAEFLLSREWARLSDDALDRRILEHNGRGRLATLRATYNVNEIKYGDDGDEQIFFQCRDKVARLEGLKTRKSEVGLVPKPEGGILRKSRSDIFSQSFLRPHRTVDDNGRTVVQLHKSGLTSKLCG